MNEKANIPIISVSDVDFEMEVLKSAQPVLVAFCAPWSRPCNILDAVLNEVAAEVSTQVKLAKVDADDFPNLSLLYEIQSIPTLLFFVQGQERGRFIGTASKEAILTKMYNLCHESGVSPSIDSQK